jgi:uncharacterized membrane protein YtjA (UPF0391 family)
VKTQGQSTNSSSFVFVPSLYQIPSLHEATDAAKVSPVWSLKRCPCTTDKNRSGRNNFTQFAARFGILLSFAVLQKSSSSQEVSMLRWALGFFIVALVAALLGFTGIAVAAAGIAKILFYLFLILFLVTLVGHLLRRA